MRQQFEEMMIMVNQALQGSNVNNNGAQATAVSANNQDIIILGGRSGSGNEKILNTVEQFNIVEGTSSELPRMNHPQVASASCVYNGDVIVAGGYDGQASSDLIEILRMDQHPLRWIMFENKLPAKLSDHDLIVYQDKLYVVGGYNTSEGKTSDAMYKVALTSPFSTKLLARMPQPRRNHRAKVVNGKLFILGGRTTSKAKDAIDNSVVVYDFITNVRWPRGAISDF